MTYPLKREHLKNWDLQQFNEKPTSNLHHADDQDIYISERSSLASLSDTDDIPAPVNEQLSSPTSLSSPFKPPKTPHTLRYLYNKTPNNGIPAAIQFQLQREQDKQAKKNHRKAPPGQGRLAPLPETKPPELADNYYPYWYYYKLKNPEWIVRQNRVADDQTVPYNPDHPPSQHAPQPVVITSEIKPEKRIRKSQYYEMLPNLHNHDQQHLDRTEKTSPHLVFDEKSQQSPRRRIYYTPLKDVDNNAYRQQRTTEQKVSPRQDKLKTENDWINHYAQTLTNKPSKNSDNFNIPSNPPKNHSKISNKHLSTVGTDEHGKHHHSHYLQNQTISSQPSEHNHNPHHHQHHHHNIIQTHQGDPSSISSHHDPRHQQHVHVRRRPSIDADPQSDVQIVDVLFTDSARPPYYQHRRGVHHLPPITHNHHSKAHAIRLRSEYYDALAQQIHDKNVQTSVEKRKIYKPDQHTRLHDRHLHHMVDRRLAV